jgi:hypothetical protein
LPKIPKDDAEYLEWVALDVGLKTSFNWMNQTKPPTVLQAIPTLPLMQWYIHISTDEDLFWLDTGVTVHISPNTRDFYSLCKIQPCSVCGLGSSSVLVIRIGDIHLDIGRGAHVTLNDVLYIPDTRDIARLSNLENP